MAITALDHKRLLVKILKRAKLNGEPGFFFSKETGFKGCQMIPLKGLPDSAILPKDFAWKGPKSYKKKRKPSGFNTGDPIKSGNCLKFQ